MSETTDLENYLDKVACSNLGIEHLKFHRNKEKTGALCYKNNKELKEVGSFILVWW